jgi:hypothetical protein
MKRDLQSNANTPRTSGERFWRKVFFVLSAAMAAFALVDLGSGRFANGLGDVGVACLMISLIPQFPFVRAIVAGNARLHSERELLQDLERVRTQSPWAETVSAIGWLMLGASLLLRALGVA